MSLRLVAVLGALLAAWLPACACGTPSGCTGPSDCGAGLSCEADGVCRPPADAGAPDAGPDFVQDVCGGFPPLFCVAFAPDGGGTSFSASAMAPVSGGFLVALERNAPHRVELFLLAGGGFGAPLATWPLSTGTLRSLSVAGSGDAWAVAWVQPAATQTRATAVACLSGTSLANIPSAPVMVSTPVVSLVSVAVNAAGDVALGASDPLGYFNVVPSTLRQGLGLGHCPAALQDTDGGMGTYASAAVSVADGGFWLMSTGAGFSVARPVGGSFAVAATQLMGWDSYEQSSAASADGSRLHTLYGFGLDDGGIGLGVKPTRIDRVPPTFDLGVTLFSDRQPQYWANAACGAGCMASTLIENNVAAPNLMVAFTDDKGTVFGLGAQEYTVSCQKSPNVNGLSVAWSLDLLGFLYTDPSHANFYLCQKPAF